MSPAAEVDADRLAQDIEAVAGFSECDPRVGFSRPTFSPSWRGARDYVVRQAEKAGCQVRVDPAGNVHARPAGMTWEERAWLCGSHIDSVPTGGKFDGVTGVVAALELLRISPGAAVELIVFAEEEGTTFGLGMLGSKAWTGTITAAELGALRNAAGQDYLSAGAPHGVDAARLSSDRLCARRYHGLIEVHVEQGPSLWSSRRPLAVVTAINGRRQYSCVLTGTANHAGSTTMEHRQDALAGAAEAITYLESLAGELRAQADRTVITVGRIEVSPNALNVIPGRALLTIDFRSPADAVLERGERSLRARLGEIAERRRLTLELERTENLPVVPMDDGVCRRLREAARRVDVQLADVTSGALHDTAIVAPVLPSAMLFVACKDGISHNPRELSRIEDIALAVRVLAEAVRS